MIITAPPLVPAQRDAWLALMEIANELPTGWCLVGGQMVHQHCWERGTSPPRPTNDGDAVLDVRAQPTILLDFTTLLTQLGFHSERVNSGDHESRWVRGAAVLDVLIPTGVGKRSADRKGVTGSTTLATPGAEQALRRSELVEIRVDGRVGRVRRPNPLGALVIKAAAYGVPLDPARDRHLTDFAVLAAMVGRRTRLADINARDIKHLRPALAALEANRPLWVDIDDAARGVDVLDRFVNPGS